MTIQKRNVTLIILTVALISMTGCSSLFSYLKNKRDRNYQEGVRLYENKNFKEAHERFKTVVSIDPDYQKTKTYLSRTTAYLKRLEKQQEIEEQKKIKGMKRQYNTAVALAKRKKYEEALAIFLEIQKEDSYYEDIQDQMDLCRDKLAWKYNQLVEKAQKQVEQKEYLKAYDTAQRAMKFNPDAKEAEAVINNVEKALDRQTKPMKAKADKLYEQKKFEAAKDTLARALEIKPWDKDIPEKIDRCYRMIAIDKQFSEAMDCYRKKDYYTAYLKMLSVNRQESNYRNCENHIDTLKGLLTRNIETYYSKGLAYYEQNKFQDAIGEWNKVLLIDPNHEKARYYKERAAAKLDMQKSLTQ